MVYERSVLASDVPFRALFRFGIVRGRVENGNENFARVPPPGQPQGFGERFVHRLGIVPAARGSLLFQDGLLRRDIRSEIKTFDDVLVLEIPIEHEPEPNIRVRQFRLYAGNDVAHLRLQITEFVAHRPRRVDHEA